MGGSDRALLVNAIKGARHQLQTFLGSASALPTPPRAVIRRCARKLLLSPDIYPVFGYEAPADIADEYVPTSLFSLLIG